MMKNYAVLLCIIFSFACSFQGYPTPCFRSPALSSTKNDIADFEYGEMRAVLDAMEKENVPSRDLAAPDRALVESYVRKVVSERPSAIPVKDIARVLPGSKWRLGFSTEGATLGDLPKDAEVQLEFCDKTRMDYILQFSKKTAGLDRLVAKSSYTVDSTSINPGLVTFVYDQIVTDVFGLKNIGVGFFGLLKGKTNYVESQYMDNRYWIERGYSPEGAEYYNVYVRQFEPGSQAEEDAEQGGDQRYPSGSTIDDQWD
mmetsp:Transcript_21170/g.31395  ORF Transcript_21170/g.31395 Transcript_21170/m.31395 type:complete len:257 (+) Transcript_21170:163-933(+)|eukprot:CAMPEP_0194213236 /NCGR_PEP_ID=MMETSP0156-20130528/13642_1 /TAXON_ID=33649 /ORGANISM="Thalassionema nitzschioides, Strain L26-B" /LENGTH=256 /DNA_ID=CAMNT_0038941223 /DNA_START=146 /DNA_END=916 /DNA_ORIENTATION=+